MAPPSAPSGGWFQQLLPQGSGAVNVVLPVEAAFRLGVRLLRDSSHHSGRDRDAGHCD